VTSTLPQAPRRRLGTDRLGPPAAVIGVVSALICLAFWPGHMSSDTLLMISQAAGDAPISDQHSPLLIWLWSLGWPIGLRPGAILVLQVGVFMVGAYLVARAAFSRLGSAVAASLIAISPPVLGYLGTLSRDAWFIGLLLVCFGLLIRALRVDAVQAKRSLVLCAVAAVLCLATRQNAAAAVFLVAVALAAWVLGPRLAGRRPVVRAGAALGAGLLATVLAMGALLGGARLAGVEQARPQQQLYIYDLAAISLRQERSLFPPDVYAGDLETLAVQSSIDSPVPLIFGPDAGIPVPRPPDQVSELGEAWREAVVDHPRTYLGVRWDAWMHQLSIGAPPVFVFHPGIDSNELGYEIAIPALNEVATDYLRLFVSNEFLDGGVVFTVWVYLLLCGVAAVILLPRPGAPRIVGLLALSAWTYQAGLFFGTMATQYRFEYPVVVIGLLSTAVAVRVLVAERSPPPELSPADEPSPPAARPTAIASG